MARRALTVAAVLAIAALSTTALAQWSFEWYVDEQLGALGDLIYDDTGITPLTADAGNFVYLIHDAGGDGIDMPLGGTGLWDGTLMDDDTIVQAWGGGWANVEVGQDDASLFVPQTDGEIHATHTLDESIYGVGNLWAVAFNGTVNVLGNQTFAGQGWYGFSAGSTTLNQNFDTWNAGSFAADQPLIPEPTTVALMIAGLGGVVAYRKKRQA